MSHMMCDGTSKKLTATITPLGLMRYNRLPIGMKDSTAMFQKLVSQALVTQYIEFLQSLYPTHSHKIIGYFEGGSHWWIFCSRTVRLLLARPVAAKAISHAFVLSASDRSSSVIAALDAIVMLCKAIQVVYSFFVEFRQNLYTK